MFLTDIERKRLGGSCFIELQYCRLPAGTPLPKLVSVGAIRFLKADSLYVSGDDQNDFFEAYKDILTGGVYNDLKTGAVDLWGINYYSPEMTDTLIGRLSSAKPPEYERLIGWLKAAASGNGFYVLGV